MPCVLLMGVVVGGRRVRSEAEPGKEEGWKKGGSSSVFVSLYPLQFLRVSYINLPQEVPALPLTAIGVWSGRSYTFCLDPQAFYLIFSPLSCGGE